MNLPDSNHICDVTIEDIDEVVRLHEIYLNYGEGVRPHFEKILRDESTIAVKYMENGIIAGILIYIKGIDFTCPNEEIKVQIQKITDGKNIYTGDAVLVIDKYRNKNISVAMYHAAKEKMKKLRVSFVVHELWVYPDGSIPAQKVLKTFGKSYKIGHYKRFYKDYYKYGYICPVCGNDCVCSAEVYVSEL